MEPKINKKRVLFVITQEEFGGAQRFIYELVTRLEPEKYEILVATGKSQSGDFLKSLNEKNINTRTLLFLRRGINPIFDALGIIELMRTIDRFKPDYLHLNSSKAGVLGSIAGLKVKKVIYRTGGWSFNDPWPFWKKKLFIAAEKITAGFKDVIVVNNKNDHEQAVKLKIRPKEKLELIHNGIDALKIEFLPKDKARLRLKVSQAEFIIGTIANFYPAKGLKYLIEAIKLLTDGIRQTANSRIKLAIIGDGEERLDLESRIKDYGLEKDIILLGRVQEAFKYIKALDVFVLPSVKEGFPWTILDAMAAKLPIIATSVGALPEIIDNGKNGILVEPKNPQQLAEAIKQLLENERTRQELGIQAHQTVLFKFPIEKMVRETETLFN